MKTFTKAALIVTTLVVSVGAYAHWHNNASQYYANTTAGNAAPGYQNAAPMNHYYQQMQQWMSQMREFCLGRQNSMMSMGSRGAQMGYGMGNSHMGWHMQGYQNSNANGQYSRMRSNMMGQSGGMGWYQQNNTSNNAAQQAN
ncbi:hypothetical protein [Celerinatantimonas sp. MCCC 1A17872]|uniref:hypothetical protein n=1 Tax=Celerinatantimonas sp. MCCC 1A17872 TaxID=3177514 RepID=UPI0038C94CC9